MNSCAVDFTSFVVTDPASGVRRIGAGCGSRPVFDQSHWTTRLDRELAVMWCVLIVGGFPQQRFLQFGRQLAGQVVRLATGYQVCSAARTSSWLTATCRARVTM